LEEFVDESLGEEGKELSRFSASPIRGRQPCVHHGSYSSPEGRRRFGCRKRKSSVRLRKEKTYGERTEKGGVLAQEGVGEG